MGNDPFAGLYKQCNTGDPADKHKNMPAFPIMIDVELTNTCNFRCLMCPTGNLSMTRPANFMDTVTYGNLLRQIGPWGTALRFIGWGEPTLHPGICNFIQQASDLQLLTHLNTNASKMTPQLATELVDAGLSSIKFSFQGVTRDGYKEMRNIDSFDRVLRAIGTMSAARIKDKPFISVSTTTTTESDKQIERFKREVADVDKVSVGKTIFDFLDLDATRLSDEEKSRIREMAADESSDHKVHPDPCPEVFNKLSVHWDGSVVLCCNDVNGDVELGNINETDLMDIWNDPRIEEYRTALAQKDYSKPLCTTCYDYQGLTEGVKQ